MSTLRNGVGSLPAPRATRKDSRPLGGLQQGAKVLYASSQPGTSESQPASVGGPCAHARDALAVNGSPFAGTRGARVRRADFARSTYADVAAHPRWLGVLLVVLDRLDLVINRVGSSQTEVGRQGRSRPCNCRRSRRSGGTGQRRADTGEMERMAPYAGYCAAVSQLVVLPLITLVVAGIAFAIFNGGARRQCDVQAGVRRRGVFKGGHGAAALFSTPLSYAQGSRCRTQRASPRGAVLLRGQHVRSQAARRDRPVLHLVDREPRDRARRLCTSAGPPQSRRGCSSRTGRSR